MALLPLAQQKGQQSLVADHHPSGPTCPGKDVATGGFSARDASCSRRRDSGQTVRRDREGTGTIGSGIGAIERQTPRRLRPNSQLPLAEIEGFADMECRLLDASQKFPRTEADGPDHGMGPGRRRSGFGDSVMGETTSADTPFRRALRTPSMQEQIPVLLKHSRLLRPFEMLVSTYGLPNYQELEPTLFVALSYIVMFGMMFGDAGHGMVLAAVWLDCSACRPVPESAGLWRAPSFRGFIQHHFWRGIRELLRYRSIQEICTLARSAGRRSHATDVSAP